MSRAASSLAPQNRSHQSRITDHQRSHQAPDASSIRFGGLAVYVLGRQTIDSLSYEYHPVLINSDGLLVKCLLPKARQAVFDVADICSSSELDIPIIVCGGRLRRVIVGLCTVYSGDMRRAMSLLARQLASQACLSRVPDIPRASLKTLSYQRLQSSEFMTLAAARHAMRSSCKQQNGSRSFPWFPWAIQERHQARQFVAIQLGETDYTEFVTWPAGGGLVHKKASVEDSVVVEVGAVVNCSAEIGDGSLIGSGSVVGSGVTIGPSSCIGHQVSLQNCVIGSHVAIHSGVKIGQDGFGFYVDEKGMVIKKPQTLGVQIGSNVEIGANSCIDRGSWRDTVIGEHTKIDNMVQVGHNVIIGKACIICAQCGIGGSAELGDYVVMGGKSAVKDHVYVASKVRIAAMAGVTKSIKEQGDFAGFPAEPAAIWRRRIVVAQRHNK